MRSLRIEVIEFKRKKEDPWERGVGVAEGSGPIIDLDGHVVPPPVYDYRPLNESILTVFDDGHWNSKRVG